MKTFRKLVRISGNMVLFSLILISEAFAQGSLQGAGTAAGMPPQPKFSEILARMSPMFLLVFFIFYFMVMRPQQAKFKSQQMLLESLKKGDLVVTSGGIVAKVAGLEQEYVLLEISNNVKMKIEAQHVLKRVGEPAELNKTEKKT